MVPTMVKTAFLLVGMPVDQACLRSVSLVCKDLEGEQGGGCQGAHEGWSTVAVVATCRLLIGPDGQAAASLPS
jgi:hypothetical protein